MKESLLNGSWINEKKTISKGAGSMRRIQSSFYWHSILFINPASISGRKVI